MTVLRLKRQPNLALSVTSNTVFGHVKKPQGDDPQSARLTVGDDQVQRGMIWRVCPASAAIPKALDELQRPAVWISRDTVGSCRPTGRERARTGRRPNLPSPGARTRRAYANGLARGAFDLNLVAHGTCDCKAESLPHQALTSKSLRQVMATGDQVTQQFGFPISRLDGTRGKSGMRSVRDTSSYRGRRPRRPVDCDGLRTFGVPCMLVERHPTTLDFPKGRRVTVRSMEIFRQWDLKQEIVQLSLPRTESLFVFSGESLFVEDFHRLDLSARKQIR